MSQLLLTIGIAFLIVIIALVLLSIGLLLTGKSGIIKGACGMDPNRLKDERCGSKDIQCDLCNPKEKEKKSYSKNQEED